MSTKEQSVAVVTGGNSGIGKWTAIGLAKAGHEVVITSRNPSRGEAALSEIKERAGTDAVRCMELDLASFASIRTFSKHLLEAHPSVKVLVNNAGLVLTERNETEEGFEVMFGVNHVGHQLLTELLLPALREAKPARIVVVASDAHKGARQGLDFDDLQGKQRFSGFANYSKSKLANIYFTRELAPRLEEDGITVNAVHPGVVRTGFGKDGDAKGWFSWAMKLASPFMLNEEQGAATSVYLATSDDVEGKTGGYYARCKPASLSRAAQDDAAAKRLWQVTESLIADAS